MPLEADLYLDRIDFARHTSQPTCQLCRVDSLEEWLERLRAGQIRGGECPHWPPQRVEAFRLAACADQWLPTIPALQTPRPAQADRFGFNDPAAASPVLVTGNSALTHEVLLAVLATTQRPIWMLSVDTAGHTVDMSLVFQTLTSKGIAEAVAARHRDLPQLTGRIILPGLAAPLAADVSQLLGRRVEVGPVCAAEIPLFFGPGWLP